MKICGANDASHVESVCGEGTLVRKKKTKSRGPLPFAEELRYSAYGERRRAKTRYCSDRELCVCFGKPSNTGSGSCGEVLTLRYDCPQGH